jgi:hypothetical protein
MKHTVAATTKVFLGEKFLAGVKSIAYGQTSMLMLMKPNQNGIVRVRVALTDDGTFQVEGLKRARHHKIKPSEIVAANELEAKVNSVTGEFLMIT